MEVTKKAVVEVRSQHSRGSSGSKWGGPDTYVAVQIIPDGVARLRYLNRSVAARRGIEIIYCGEGYQDRQKTTRSALGAALAKAHKIADEINNQQAAGECLD